MLPPVLAVAVLLTGWLSAAAVPALAGASAPSASSPSVTPPPPTAPPGWATVFLDNFSGKAGSTPAAANWFYDLGTGWGTGDVAQTTNSTKNVFTDGHGNLVLRAIRSGGAWTSGRIESTRDDFRPPSGGELEITASIKQPNPAHALGYWPAFWLLGAPIRAGASWPAAGEIDLLEDVNGLNKAAGTLHWATGESDGLLFACPGASCDTAFHTYSVLINRTNPSKEFLRFLVNGKVTETITEAKVGAAAWQKAVDHGFYMILDVEIGGTYPDFMCGCSTPVAATSAVGSMDVAYVAVYQKGGSTATPRPVKSGHVTGTAGWCLANKNGLNVAENPVIDRVCDKHANDQWSSYSDGTLRTQGACLDVVNGGQGGWYPCNGTASQVWTMQANGELVSKESGQCLTYPYSEPGAQVLVQGCGSASGQHWKIVSS